MTTYVNVDTEAVPSLSRGLQPNEIAENDFPNDRNLVDIVKEAIQTNNVFDFFKIYISPGDGHCFLHSIVRYLNICMPNMIMSLSALKSIIRSETTSNSHIYNSIYRGSSTTQLFAEMELYVNNRIFETLFGDLVPLVVANALNSNVIIINKQVNGGHNMHTVPPNTSAQISGNITVYKTGKHYDACLPKSSARAESVEISPLKYVPLAENISDKAGVKPGRDQSNQHRSISVPYGRCDISNDDHDISTDLHSCHSYILEFLMYSFLSQWS